MDENIKRNVGFDKSYWDKNYDDLDTMDGVANAKEHANYLKSLFGLEYIDISSVVDFGFGLGYLFEEILKTFLPYKAIGIEPSNYAFKLVSQREIAPVASMKLKLEEIDLLKWCKKNEDSRKRFDLGICTSVFQYLHDDEIEEILRVMAKQVKYLYFSVPTDKELDRQIEELEFTDEYAIRRSRTKYQKMLKKQFTFVSSRLLESKLYFDEKNTALTDLLFRF